MLLFSDELNMICYRIFCLMVIVVCSDLFQGINCSTFSSCYTLKVGSKPVDLESAGWGKDSLFGASISDCIETCATRFQKYAAIETAAHGKAACYCGTERSYEQLGTADHTDAHTPCHHREWTLRVYVASGDVGSQYVGCYKEEGNTDNVAHWIDKWIMTPGECINYCKANRAHFANIRHGDMCFCGSSFAKYGKVDDSLCNKPCAGSLGEKCGGDLAISVYYTTTLQNMLRSDSSPTVILKSRPVAKVSVPYTLALINELYGLEESLSLKLPVGNSRLLRDHMTSGVQLLQAVADMVGPFHSLAKSTGFSVSNSPSIKHLLSTTTFPLELQSYVNVILRAHSFVDQDVNRLLEVANNASQSVDLLRPVVEKAEMVFDSYFHGNTLTLGVQKTLQAAQLMISASKNCLPLLETGKVMMTNNLESAARTLMEGPQGTDRYILTLKGPPPNITSITAPVIDASVWMDNLAYVSQSWSAFMTSHGKELLDLVQKNYYVCLNPPGGVNSTHCVSSTLLTFGDMVGKAGTNEAKKDMEKFISKNRVVYKAVDWTVYEEKLRSIRTDFKSVTDYLQAAGTSTPSGVQVLTESMTSFQLYESCVSKVTSMVEDVCYKLSYPDDSKVKPITC